MIFNRLDKVMIRNRINNLNLKGSFTIELSLISMTTFSVIILTLMLGIYLHEVTVLKTIVNESIVKAEEAVNGNMPYSQRLENDIYSNNIVNRYIYNNVREYIITQSASLLFDKNNIVEKLEITIDIKNYVLFKKISVRVIKYSNSLLFSKVINKIRLGEGNNIEVYSTSKIYCKTETIRNIDFIDDITTDVDAISKFKIKYYESIRSIKEKIKSLIELK